MKLFELEVSERKASFQVNLSYPTTLKGFNQFAEEFFIMFLKMMIY